MKLRTDITAAIDAAITPIKVRASYFSTNPRVPDAFAPCAVVQKCPVYSFYSFLPPAFEQTRHFQQRTAFIFVSRAENLT